MPPAILNAGIVMPKKLKMNVPGDAERGQHEEARQRRAERRPRLGARSWLPVSARKIGSAANGSTIEKSDPKQTSA